MVRVGPGERGRGGLFAHHLAAEGKVKLAYDIGKGGGVKTGYLRIKTAAGCLPLHWIQGNSRTALLFSPDYLSCLQPSAVLVPERKVAGDVSRKVVWAMGMPPKAPTYLSFILTTRPCPHHQLFHRHYCRSAPLRSLLAAS